MSETKTESKPKHHRVQQIKQVALVRQHAKYFMAKGVAQFRAWLSMQGENVHVVDLMRDEKIGMGIVARVTDTLLTEIGDNADAVDPANPKIRRPVSRLMQVKRGRAAAAARGDAESDKDDGGEA